MQTEDWGLWDKKIINTVFMSMFLRLMSYVRRQSSREQARVIVIWCYESREPILDEMSLNRTRTILFFLLIPNHSGKAGDLKGTTDLNHFYSLIHPTTISCALTLGQALLK